MPRVMCLNTSEKKEYAARLQQKFLEEKLKKQDADEKFEDFIEAEKPSYNSIVEDMIELATNKIVPDEMSKDFIDEVSEIQRSKKARKDPRERSRTPKKRDLTLL